jgi:hypothetical protein
VGILRCQYCPCEYRESGGTTIIANHLKSHNVHCEKDQTATNQQLNILTAFQHGEHSQAKRRRINDDSINPATLKQVLRLPEQPVCTAGLHINVVAVDYGSSWELNSFKL